jgi:hypothetical protein
LIDLPNPTQPALASFWLVASASAGVSLALALWILQVPHPVTWGVLAVAICGIPGLLQPALVKRPYQAWNRLSGTARRAARIWLTGVAFLIISVVGRSGTRLAWRAPEASASGWTPKRPLPEGNQRSTSDIPSARESDRGWIRDFAAWARRSGNVWAWSLVPVLALLKVVEGKPTRSLGGNVYTLY